MTPAQIEQVQNTYQLLHPKMQAVTDKFYARLFEKLPEARGLFPEDMREQRKKLIETLNYAVNNLKYPDLILPTLKKLGARHKNYGASDAAYAAVGEALIHAITESAGNALSASDRNAWIACYGVLSQVMKDGAKEAA